MYKLQADRKTHHKTKSVIDQMIKRSRLDDNDYQTIANLSCIARGKTYHKYRRLCWFKSVQPVPCHHYIYAHNTYWRYLANGGEIIENFI